MLLPLVALFWPSFSLAQTKIDVSQISITNTVIVDPVINTLPGAINNAASGTLVIIPPGTYSMSSGITITHSNVHVNCAGINSTIIKYTGSTLTAFVDVGTADNGSANQQNDSINNCTFSGNANTTYVLRTRGVHRSDFSNNSLINATTSALYADFSVLDNYNRLHTSSNEQSFTTTPANCIIVTGPNATYASSTNDFDGTICEGVTGDGISVGYSQDAHFSNGTSEANSRGFNITANANRTVLDSMDLEANSTEDALINGTNTTFKHVLMGSTTTCELGSTGYNLRLETSYPSSLVTPCTVDAGGAGLYYIGPTTIAPATASNVVWDNTAQNLTNKSIGGTAISNVPYMTLSCMTPGVTAGSVIICAFTPVASVTFVSLNYQVPTGGTVGAGCGTQPIINIGGSATSNLTLANGNNSGSVSFTQNVSGGNVVNLEVSTGASGCSPNWANVNITAQYRMQ